MPTSSPAAPVCRRDPFYETGGGHMKFDLSKKANSFQNALKHIAEIVEIILGVIILFYCVVSTAGSVLTIDMDQLFQSAAYLQQQLSNACLIIIGIELIIMITSYSVDAVVDVMLLAVSRQMIVEHSTPMENLLTVVAVALLFVIRKYLYISKFDKRSPTKGGKDPGESDR